MWEWLQDGVFGSTGGLDFGEMVLRLGVATILGALIGLERERLERAAGLRTHALVSVGSALIMVVSTYGFPDGLSNSGLDPSRIAAQVVSGIGFLGAGVIIFRENSVRGLTTAATVWCVAGVGLAAGGGLFAPAIVGTTFMLILQAGIKPLEQRFFARHAQQHRLMMEVTHGADVLTDVEDALQGSKVRIKSLDFDQADRFGLDTVELTLVAERVDEVLDIVNKLRLAAAVKRIHYRRGGSIIRKQERTMYPNGDDEDDDVTDEDLDLLKR